MLFKKDLIDLILAGKKTMTSRSKKLCDVGDLTNLMANKDYSKLTGKYLRITKVYRKFLGEFTVEDSHKEGFEGLGEFKSYWEQNIGSWDPTQFLWIHEFDIELKKMNSC